ncbi:MAG TPA: hypothetical protein VMA53_15020 [Stellaceae bacterium]|nr:hypothetical protein [Stellaceae bacterium]
MTVSIGTLLTSTLTTSAQNKNQLTLNAINNTLTTRLNNQIAQLESQSSDTTTVDLLQNQLSAAQTQNSAFSTAASQALGNESFLTDINSQLTTMNTAAANGDSTTFDSALAAAQSDIADLTVVNFVPGTQPDGVANLKYDGLGVQSSATYDLSTASGQAQAATDIANAKTLVSQVLTTTTQNQEIATSQSAGLTDDINNLTLQLSQISDNQNNTVQAQITKLQQQEQEQYHVIELALSGTANANSVLTTAASNLTSVLASQPGSKTAPTTNAFYTALQTGVSDANELTSTRLGDATTQPSASTQQDNTVAQGASGALLDIFS